MAAVADAIETAFQQHYQRTSPHPDAFEDMMLRDRESDFYFSRHGEPIVFAIQEAAEIEEAIAVEVQKILGDRYSDLESAQMGEECEFDSDAHYEPKSISDFEFRQDWLRFEESLKTESRFFNKGAESVLASLFEGLADHKTFEGRAVVIGVGPGQQIFSFYRARVFQSDQQLDAALKRPDREIGPPPVHAALGGRMNAYGISVFYGATDPSTALAEIRPPVGSRVMLGKFELLRELRLLDVEALRSVLTEGSIFDPAYVHKLEKAKFLGRLGGRISRPVMPNDEPSDYLVTQAIADFLASHAKIDGILYPSAQVGGEKTNVVLFHNASRVEALEFPPGTKLEAQTNRSSEEGPEPDYYVWETVPKAKAPPPARDEGFPHIMFRAMSASEAAGDLDARSPTLRLDLESVQVHHIDAVNFVTSSHTVRRHRSTELTESEEPF